MKKLINKIFPKRFGTFWNKNKNNTNFDYDIRSITENFINSPSYQYVSNQWHLLNIITYQKIMKTGLDNYGSDISTHFFTFLDFENEYLDNLLFNNNTLESDAELFKLQKNLNYKQSLNYNLLCLMLYKKLQKSSYFNHLGKLNDKTYLESNNPFIKIDKYNISSDKIISLFDLQKIEKFIEIKDNFKILEIGAGSGRLSECILSTKEKINYVICDIPPSIYISFKRLKSAFPNKKINLFFDIDKKSLQRKVSESEISFIFPHQLDYFNNNFFNMTLAVDCFHEMDKKTIKKYFDFINQISSNFYFSIWSKTKNWYSGGLFKKTERLDFEKGDYPIPDNWDNKLKENLEFPSNQIALGYKINN